MRNTKEWYFFLDRLVQNQKKLYFYLERKYYSPDDALITGIKAILAEEFSRSLSKNINSAHRKRQEAGSSVILTSRTWGYDNRGGKIVVNEKEAGMVRFIYEMAAQNYGSRKIANMLWELGYLNHEGNKIAEQTVRRIVRNPLYKGTAVMNVLHKNFETKKVERNSKEQWIYHDHLVPAVVSEQLWQRANRQMDARSQALSSKTLQKKTTGYKRHVNFLTGKIQCGLCGGIYWRCTAVSGKKRTIYWNCREYVQRGRKTKTDSGPAQSIKGQQSAAAGCDNIHIKEQDLDAVMYALAQRFETSAGTDIRAAAVAVLKQAVKDAPDLEKQEQALAAQVQKTIQDREGLLELFLDHKIEEGIYQLKDASLKETQTALEGRLKGQREVLMRGNNMRREAAARMEGLETEVERIVGYDMRIKKIKEKVSQIIVYPDHLTIRFEAKEAGDWKGGEFDSVDILITKVSCRKTEYHICL